MKAPSGSQPWSNSSSYPEGTVTIAQYAQALGADASGAGAIQSLFGGCANSTLTHRDWMMPDGHGADVVLARCTSSAEAGLLTTELQSLNTDWTGVSLSGKQALDSQTVSAPQTDTNGDIQTEAVAQDGDVVLWMRYFSPGKLDTTTLSSWADQQLNLLNP